MPENRLNQLLFDNSNKLAAGESVRDERRAAATGDPVTFTWAPVTRIAEERQVLRDDGTDETRFVWDNQNIVREVENSSLEAEFTYQPQQSRRSGCA